MSWFEKNYKLIIRLAYIVPILFAVYISVNHVITWYALTNPISWAIYLSVGIEVAALSALAGITIHVNKFVYIPFIIVTIIQFVGNVFFCFQYIDVHGKLFTSWVELMSVLNWLKPNDIASHKFFLSLISGGFVAIISLSFLHLLIKFNESELNKKENNNNLNIEEINKITNNLHTDYDEINPQDAVISDVDENINKDIEKKEINQLGSDNISNEDTKEEEKIKVNSFIDEDSIKAQEQLFKDQYEESDDLETIAQEAIKEEIEIKESITEPIIPKQLEIEIPNQEIVINQPISNKIIKTKKSDNNTITRIGTNKDYDFDNNLINFRR